MTITDGQFQRRAAILLRAAAEIVSKSGEAQEMTAIWDGTECDGLCLIEDINSLLEYYGGSYR